MVAEEEADVDAEESCWGVVMGTVPWLSERGISSWRLRFVGGSATVVCAVAAVSVLGILIGGSEGVVCSRFSAPLAVTRLR